MFISILNSRFSFRKKWYDFCQFSDNTKHLNRNIDQETIHFSPTTQLTIHYPIDTKEKSYFIRHLTPVLSGIQFTSLDIIYSYTLFSNMIIELINLLPNLRSLSVSYSIFPRYCCLSENERIENKIEKVRIGKVNGLNEFDFFNDLCPQMEYLEIDVGNNIQLDLLLRTILKENEKPNHHLNSLYFNIREANDNIIENLRTIINTENLLSDYSLIRTGSRIDLTLNN